MEYSIEQNINTINNLEHNFLLKLEKIQIIFDLCVIKKVDVAASLICLFEIKNLNLNNITDVKELLLNLREEDIEFFLNILNAISPPASFNAGSADERYQALSINDCYHTYCCKRKINNIWNQPRTFYLYYKGDSNCRVIILNAISAKHNIESYMKLILPIYESLISLVNINSEKPIIEISREDESSHKLEKNDIDCNSIKTSSAGRTDNKIVYILDRLIEVFQEVEGLLDAINSPLQELISLINENNRVVFLVKQHKNLFLVEKLKDDRLNHHQLAPVNSSTQFFEFLVINLLKKEIYHVNNREAFSSVIRFILESVSIYPVIVFDRIHLANLNNIVLQNLFITQSLNYHCFNKYDLQNLLIEITKLNKLTLLGREACNLILNRFCNFKLISFLSIDNECWKSIFSLLPKTDI